jgi:hypothetical protein
MMTLSGCLRTQTNIVSDGCYWLNPYPKLNAEQYIAIHNIAPIMSTWARDYKIEYKAKCLNKNEL